MTIGEANRAYKRQLLKIYTEGEARKITEMVFEKLFSMSPASVIVHKHDPVSDKKATTLNQTMERLLNFEPVQYVLQEAWFLDMPLYVDNTVLIPRPETEELVAWILEEEENKRNLKVLDIGTGSGCIAISLKRQRMDFQIFAVDVSESALEVARRNALKMKTDIGFMQKDVLRDNLSGDLPLLDIIVSNPPYIPVEEKMNMDKQVVDFEPGTALFVPDEKALVFYEKIAQISRSLLNADGRVYVEINEELGQEVKLLFEKYFKKAELRKDINGRDRMMMGESLL